MTVLKYIHTIILIAYCVSSDTPGKVKDISLERNSPANVLTTQWTSVPSLDINDTDPDIVYSVELYQITCGQNILLMNSENVTGNNTSNNVDPMQIYRVVVAARNNVEEARKGPSVEMRGKKYKKVSIIDL